MTKKSTLTEAAPSTAELVDAALARGAEGMNSLPPELHAAFDLIVSAFAHYEAGRDEEARTALQGIGLSSPFLEWKMLLRGLIAYQSNDDVRALENWQRLDPKRLPYRLSITLRANIDPAFLAAQTVKTQSLLKAKLQEHHGGKLASLLQELRPLLAKENLAPAFRKAEPIGARLRTEHPQLLPRLAQCFFWAIVEHGQPEDVDRYLRVFGAPADDPKLHRLHAIALEARGMWSEAHKAWQNFLTFIEKNSMHWPGETSARVQALIWSRMAENAHPRMQRPNRSGNPFFDLFAMPGKPLKPSAEQCYENAIRLAPDRLESYRKLLGLHLDEDRLPKAKKVAQEIIKRFPDHEETLEVLGDLHMETNAYKQAEECFAKALSINPLDRTLRGKLARAKQNLGLKYVLEGKLDKARAQFEQALAMWEGGGTSLLCLWAAAELKAGKPERADELIAKALAAPDRRLACRFMLVGASVRAQLPPKEKKRIAAELKAALAEAPTPAEILVLLENAALQRQVHEDTFHGQKSQEKTIIKFTDAIDLEAFSEQQLERLCRNLQMLNARKSLLRCLNHARRKHPRSPAFRLAFVDYYLLEDNDPKTHLAREHLDQARRLVEQLPRGEQQQQYLERMKRQEEVIAELNAQRPTMFDFLGDILDPDAFDEDDEDIFGDE
jgi:tetratricopeptide (TPR) repeat protein